MPTMQERQNRQQVIGRPPAASGMDRDPVWLGINFPDRDKLYPDRREDWREELIREVDRSRTKHRVSIELKDVSKVKIGDRGAVATRKTRNALLGGLRSGTLEGACGGGGERGGHLLCGPLALSCAGFPFSCVCSSR